MWIFQAIPEDYNLANALRAGDPQVWRVSSYATEIAPGDRVFLWSGNPGRGILAVARTGDVPSLQDFPEHQYRFVVADTPALKRKKFGHDVYVPIIIERNLLPSRISADRLKAHLELKDLSILRMAQGTNFKVAPHLQAILERFVSEWPPPGYPA